MKKFILPFMLCFSVIANAQTPFPGSISCSTPEADPVLDKSGKSSTHGLKLTPKGQVHLLFIFVGYNHTISDYDFGSPGDPNYWQHTDIPTWAKGDYNQIIDKDFSNVGNVHNLTDYYDVMSMGNFQVTGEIFPEQIMIDPITDDDGALQYNDMAVEVYDYINTNYPDYDWGRFDNRKHNPGYNTDNDGYDPDDILDYVIWIWRDDRTSGGNNQSFGGEFTTNYGGTTKTYEVKHGHRLIGDKNNPSTFRFVNIYELGHNLYGAPHYGGANQTCGPHLKLYAGSGMMTEHGFYNCANAWERWYLGWSEITYDLKDHGDHGTYLLEDFLTTGNAIRMEIPNSNGKQHLWIEYHDLSNRYDVRRSFGKDKSGSTIPPAPEGFFV